MKLVISTILLSTLLYTAFYTTSAHGQSFQGSLRGRVLDPNGGTTPAAKLTLTDEATSIARATVSNEQGEFNFTALTPATYTVTVEAAGFKRLDHKGVVVSTQVNVTLDFVLELGHGQ